MLFFLIKVAFFLVGVFAGVMVEQGCAVAIGNYVKSNSLANFLFFLPLVLGLFVFHLSGAFGMGILTGLAVYLIALLVAIGTGAPNAIGVTSPFQSESAEPEQG